MLKKFLSLRFYDFVFIVLGILFIGNFYWKVVPLHGVPDAEFSQALQGLLSLIFGLLCLLGLWVSAVSRSLADLSNPTPEKEAP